MYIHCQSSVWLLLIRVEIVMEKIRGVILNCYCDVQPVAICAIEMYSSAICNIGIHLSFYIIINIIITRSLENVRVSHGSRLAVLQSI